MICDASSPFERKRLRRAQNLVKKGKIVSISPRLSLPRLSPILGSKHEARFQGFLKAIVKMCAMGSKHLCMCCKAWALDAHMHLVHLSDFRYLTSVYIEQYSLGTHFCRPNG